MRVRREMEGKRSKSMKRRVSTGDAIERPRGLLDSSGGGARRVSTGMVQIMRGMSLSEEPEDMHDIKEDAEDGVEETLDDEGLPEWAKRAAFIDDKIGIHVFISSFLNFILYLFSRACTCADTFFSPVTPSNSLGHLASDLEDFVPVGIIFRPTTMYCI